MRRQDRSTTVLYMTSRIAQTQREAENVSFLFFVLCSGNLTSPFPFAVHGNIVCTVSKEKAEELDIKLRNEERRADQIARREREREDLGVSQRGILRERESPLNYVQACTSATTAADTSARPRCCTRGIKERERNF